ncbi:hypothetical protein FTX61_07200 [Nitriliruptoraceae bacterium ZYF776]|nr:hypothetical protein [Profundirhabdus halotolerans]
MRDADRTLTARGRWLAVTAATVAYQFVLWPTFVGVAAAVQTDAATAADAPGEVGLLFLGLGLVPFVFLVLAFGSRHPRAAGATGKALLLFLLIGLPIGLFNVVLGVAVGTAAGGVLALRPPKEVDSRRWRIAATGFVALYLAVLTPVVPPFALVSAAVLPLAALAFADQVVEGMAGVGT